MFASPAVYTRRCALAAQLRKLHLGIGQIFLRDMTVQCDEQHPCWKAAHFLPCTRPPDVMRLHRSPKRATYGPSERRAFVSTRSGLQTMPLAEDDTAPAVVTGAAAGPGRRYGAAAGPSRCFTPAASFLLSSRCRYLRFTPSVRSWASINLVHLATSVPTANL